MFHEYRWKKRFSLHKGIADYGEEIKIYPLPHMKVVKDLVTDLTNFYKGKIVKII